MKPRLAERLYGNAIRRNGCLIWLGNRLPNGYGVMSHNGKGGDKLRGELSSTAKLTSADVLAIRASTETQSVLSARYGVGQAQISRIRTGKQWAHL